MLPFGEKSHNARIAFSVILARQGRNGILFAVATQIYGISLYITAPSVDMRKVKQLHMFV